jgi:hypothetical protein
LIASQRDSRLRTVRAMSGTLSARAREGGRLQSHFLATSAQLGVHMTIRILSLATVLVALALPMSASAHQNNGAALTKPISNYSISSNNRATTENFSISYDSGGHFDCDETRIVKVSPKAFTKDSGTCIVTGSSLPAGSYTLPDFGWLSDYEYFIVPGYGTIRPAVSGNIEVFDNGDGTQTWDITAYY